MRRLASACGLLSLLLAGLQPQALAQVESPLPDAETALLLIRDGRFCQAFWWLEEAGPTAVRPLAPYIASDLPPSEDSQPPDDVSDPASWIDRVRAACHPVSPTGPAMVALPSGALEMESAEGTPAQELPAFRIDRDEVQVAAFRRCVEAGVCERQHFGDHGWDRSCNLGAPLRSQHPINCVDWEGARSYCEWRGLRLPTDAELRWASTQRGAAPNPWGSAPVSCQRANFAPDGESGCGSDGTRAAGSSPEGDSPEGVHDLVGNVAEWTADAWLEPSDMSVEGARESAPPPAARHGPDPRYRVVHGGGWLDPAPRAHGAARQGLNAASRLPDVGFRCAGDQSELATGASVRLPTEGTVRPTWARFWRERSLLVPGLTFVRGSRPGVGDPDEAPQRRLRLNTFRIGRTEVTVEQYRRCVEDGGCRSLGFQTHADQAACNYGAEGRGQHPMNCVSWHGAQELCHWALGRLPSEAEWERAARGADRRDYPWGNQLPDCEKANGSGCGRRGTDPVGQHPRGASPFGVHDMAGNVREWVADYYQLHYYGLAPEANPPGPPAGSSRVTRGGGFTDGPAQLRAAYRFLHEPWDMVPEVGFRCVWDDPPVLEPSAEAPTAP